MTLEEAFKKMIQAYFDDDEDEDEVTTKPKVLTKERLKQTEDEIMERKGKKNADE